MSVTVPGSKHTGSEAMTAFLSLFESRSKLGLGNFLLRFMLGVSDGDGDGTWVLWDCVSDLDFSLRRVRDDLWFRFILGVSNGDGDGTWVLWDCVSDMDFSPMRVRDDLWFRGL